MIAEEGFARRSRFARATERAEDDDVFGAPFLHEDAAGEAATMLLEQGQRPRGVARASSRVGLAEQARLVGDGRGPGRVDGAR